jgi:hypothetical protein
MEWIISSAKLPNRGERKKIVHKCYKIRFCSPDGRSHDGLIFAAEIPWLLKHVGVKHIKELAGKTFECGELGPLKMLESILLPIQGPGLDPKELISDKAAKWIITDVKIGANGLYCLEVETISWVSLDWYWPVGSSGFAVFKPAGIDLLVKHFGLTKPEELKGQIYMGAHHNCQAEIYGFVLRILQLM